MFFSRPKQSTFHSTFPAGAIILAILLASVGLLLASVGTTALGLEFPGPAPGESTARLEGDRLVMKNGLIETTWNLAADRTGYVILQA